MIKQLGITTALLGAFLAVRGASAQSISADGAMQTFHFLSDQYFSDVYFKFSPTNGTAAGLHEYDAKLEDYSAAGVAREVAALHEFEKKVEAIDPSALDAPMAADQQILLNNIKSELLTLEVIRGWEKNPDTYSSGITNSAFVIMERPYAPANVRLRSLVEREKQMPRVFDEARKNLKNPPKIFTQIALEQVDGDISFFENDVPSAFFGGADGAEVATDKDLKAEFAQTNAAVIAALKSYEEWMKTDLLPRSNGDFRLGADTFEKKLQYDEMVDLPLDRLLQIAMDDLHKNQAEFARVAKEVDPTKTPQQVLAELATMHPAPDQLLNSFHDTFNSLIEFIDIITIPSTVQPTLEETPPFMRATTFASMDPPGPFETHSKKAYFNVTLPEKDWTAQHIAEHMASFNVGTIVSTSVHEAYPGHYVQFLWMPQFGSKIRKVLGANTNIEGWAHYCEQMMLDEGYDAPPPNATPEQVKQSRLIRLGQIQDALLRDARFVNSIKLHTGQGEANGQWTMDQAINFFVTEGYQSRAVGEVETKRGTGDPTYLYYTLGKLEIMKLREDYKKKMGAAYTIEGFHDAFMKQGFAPIKVIRKAMLGNDSPVL
jgi:uncharacterized protein (DUF885 family)